MNARFVTVLVCLTVSTLPSLESKIPAAGFLIQALKTGRMGHALLLCGTNTSLGKQLAVGLAQAWNCPDSPAGCGTCASCDLFGRVLVPQDVDSESRLVRHPDLLWLEPEGKSATISIEAIRKMIAMLALPPHQAKVRAVVISDANAMRGPAANALLKSLEEPPSHTRFILLSTAPFALLPTIRSRCQRLFLPPETHRADSAESNFSDYVESASAPDSLTTERILELADSFTDGEYTAPGQLSELVWSLHEKMYTMLDDHDSLRPLLRQIKSVLDAYKAAKYHNTNPRLTGETLLYQLRRQGTRTSQ